MIQQKFCDKCNQGRTCRDLYRRLGEAKGPSIVLQVLLAFVAPMLVFIGCLAVFERLLGGTIEEKPLRTAIIFFSALIVTFAAILIIRAVKRRFGKKK
jgi:hypothetical protein